MSGMKIRPYFKRGTFTPHTQRVKIHPNLLHRTTFTVHSVHLGWKFTRDFYIVQLSQFAPLVKIHPRLLHRTTFTVHSIHLGWKFTRDFYIVQLSQFAPWVKIHPRLLHRTTFTVCTLGENSPMTFTQWNCHSVYCGWGFTHGFNTVKFYRVHFVAIFLNYYFTNILDFLSTCAEKKSW